MRRQNLEELTVTYSFTRNLFDDGTGIHLATDGTTLKGKATFTRGSTYRLFGRWFEHHKYGRQFVFDNYVEDTPINREGVIHWLASNLKGVGHITARKLWDAYGEKCLDVLQKEPERVVADGHLSKDHADKAVQMLASTAATRKTTLELLSLFKGRGFYKTAVGDCIKRWGAQAPELIRADPYLLCIAEIPGCGFKRCDQLYLDLKHDPAALRRQVMCLVHALKSDASGSTWLSQRQLQTALEAAIGGTAVRFRDAVLDGIENEWIVLRSTPEGNFYAHKERADAEATVAAEIKRLMAFPQCYWPMQQLKAFVKASAGTNVKAPTKHQMENLSRSCKRPVGFLVGTPGTGKTFTAAALVDAVIKTHGSGNLAVCAPTGKAAVRLMESMQANGVSVQATTIHRLLKYGVRTDGTVGFQYNAHQKLPYRFYIMDEVSMCGSGIMAAFLSALPEGAHVLFIGDKYQLPPVEHGAFLRDMLDFLDLRTSHACGELTEIKRNAGLIVQACRRLKEQKRIQTCHRFNAKPGDNLRWCATSNPQESIATLQRFMKQLQSSRKWDMFDDVQVICAVNNKSPLARVTLNKLLQDQLNPLGQRAEPNPFRIGDKIICLKNGQATIVSCGHADHEVAKSPTDASAYSSTERGEDDKPLTEYIANGEIGRVIAIAPKITIAHFQNPERTIKILMGKAPDITLPNERSDDKEEPWTGCDFDLAYAVSCHKMQGSEAPIVVIMIDDYPGATFVCSREWHYTALSRGRVFVLMIGKRSTFDRHCRQVFIRRRKTFLVELLHEAETAASVPAHHTH